MVADVTFEAQRSTPRSRELLAGPESLQAPDAVAPRDLSPAQRGHIDVEDHLGPRAESMDDERSGNQRCHHDNASAVGPRMIIIKHSTHPSDQLGETLAAVRRGVGSCSQLEFGRMVGMSVKAPAGPCSEITLTQLGDRFRVTAEADGGSRPHTSSGPLDQDATRPLSRRTSPESGLAGWPNTSVTGLSALRRGQR